VANLHAKFEVSIFNRSRDMAVLPKFQKVRNMIPYRHHLT